MAIICHCEVVKERTIVKAIQRGARTLCDVQEDTGAASRCGGCTEAVLELLAKHAPDSAGLPLGGSLEGRLAACVATPR